MKKAVYIFLALAAFGCQQKETPKASTTMSQMEGTFEQARVPAQSIYDFEFKTLQGEDIVLSNYKGRKMLIVNTASECGYTPQYKELQELYDKHGDKVVVLGFPANNFGGQEPGSNQEIAAFCEKNFGVTFPVFEKISVAGDDMHPFYKFLSSKELNGVTDEKPNWNFCKYLIDENGKVQAFFNSKVSPMSNEMLTAIHK
ncbi:glutathione peroxidase [Adhaeribacter sp. BT258]|uniref:Glutathione peroxidase n=1 Tax=Adhaeribacter terrigena TaxID=2793070 RepID=A0ABS1C5H6_9BACT|nr:glutathione peroxidase [Adhaeribacter terrigena]MBK0404626.1 glutathione peroxidase [Adhaeribacter terrigena]